MSRSRRCCCCQDLYVIPNGGTIVRGYRVKDDRITNMPNTARGFQTIFNTLVVDYYNKFLFTYKTTTRTIDRCNLDLSGIISVCVPARLTGTTEFMGVACDPINRRLFYATPFSATAGQLRSVNYDGSNDVQLTTETIISGSAFFSPVLLTYDPAHNRVYYITEPAASVAGSFNNSFIKYIDATTGGGKTTIVSNTATGFDTNLCQSLDIANRRQRIVWSINEVRSGVQTYKLNHAKLDGSDVVTILSRPVADGQIFQAHVSEENDAIYFVTGMGPPNANVRSKVEKIDFDGSGQEIIMTGAQGDVPFGSASGGVAFTIGCGFEKTGPATFAI